MKKSFLNPILVVLLGFSIFSLFAFAQVSDKSATDGYVTVKVIETYEVPIKPEVIVSDSKSIIKIVPLEKLSAKDAPMQANSITINAILDELKSQGYKLTSSNSFMENAFHVSITNYIFEK
jgi:hypothetical protein